jgi:hypothetical protein
MDDEATFDLDAAGLRADGADLATGVEVLARKLEDALPQWTRVRRRSTRLFGGDKVVESIEVRLGKTRYGLQVDGHDVTADCQQEVRGIVIKREQVEVADWVTRLTDELREQATGSAEARSAFERLMG